ncbi:MAG: dihydroorotase [Methylococcales bacterium]|jgi:dihydroorotase|nr:dihydroorotase [Methylococcales bacterium]
MPVNYSIRNGRVIDPANDIDRITDLYIADGKMLAIDQEPPGFEADLVIDAKDKLVCPGFVDLWGRLQEPRLHDKTTLSSEIQAAVSTGITTICSPPDRAPITDTPAVVEVIQRCAEESHKVQILPIGALTKKLEGQQISEMAALKASGCRVLSNARLPITNTLVLRRAMEYAASHDLTLFLHPEDHWLANEGVMHEGEVSTRLGLPGIPDAAECIAVARDLALVDQTGVKAHFCHISSHKSLKLIMDAQSRGMPITASVTLNHCFLTDVDCVEFNSNCHVQPPFRTKLDRDALREALLSGVIQAISSDHHPMAEDEKAVPFQASTPGVSTYDGFLPLLLTLAEGSAKNLRQVIAAVTCNPAKILNLKTGSLSLGMDANLNIINPNRQWTLSHETAVSKGLNNPHLSQSMTGQIDYTLFQGRIVFSRKPS